MSKRPYVILFNLTPEEEQQIIDWKTCDDSVAIPQRFIDEMIVTKELAWRSGMPSGYLYSLSSIGLRLQRSINYRRSDEHKKEARLRNL